MKVKVVDRFSDCFGMIMNVKSLNYKYIAVVLPEDGKKIKMPFNDVEFIFDYEWEKSIVKYRDILKISLPPSVSIKFYGAICYAIEQYYEGEIKDIVIIMDTNEKARKNHWYKRLYVVINGEKVAVITASGRDYDDNYNINIEDVDINSFVYECKDGICRLKELIQKSIEKINQYEKVINGLGSLKNTNTIYKAIEGR